MTIDLEAIEARAEAATPGPWTACPEKLYVFAPDGSPVAEMRGAGAEKRGQRTEGSQERNCEFIANAHQDVPALIAEVRRLEALFQQTHGVHHSWVETAQRYRLEPRYSAEAVDTLLEAVESALERGLKTPTVIADAARAARASREPAK